MIMWGTLAMDELSGLKAPLAYLLFLEYAMNWVSSNNAFNIFVYLGLIKSSINVHKGRFGIGFQSNNMSSHLLFYFFWENWRMYFFYFFSNVSHWASWVLSLKITKATWASWVTNKLATLIVDPGVEFKKKVPKK